MKVPWEMQDLFVDILQNDSMTVEEEDMYTFFKTFSTLTKNNKQH